jgi:hypothetical protein
MVAKSSWLLLIPPPSVLAYSLLVVAIAQLMGAAASVSTEGAGAAASLAVVNTPVDGSHAGFAATGEPA